MNGRPESAERAAGAEARDTAALRRLAARVGHDLNNLLFVLEANLDFLRDAGAENADLAGPMSAIERSVHLAGMLAANLMTFAGRQSLQVEAVDVSASLERASAVLSRVLPSSIAVERQAPADLWPARADPRLLLYAMLNLGLNARDAMPDGGRLTVTLANRRLDPAADLDRVVDRAGDYVAVTFRDSGTGMTEDRIARALGRGAGGTGPDDEVALGLPTVRAMVRALGGGLSIQSERGRGAAVTVLLPRAG